MTVVFKSERDFLSDLNVSYGESCRCDFCTGRKHYADNWCARCGNVQMKPPKWWENEDVCDECEAPMWFEAFAEEIEHDPGDEDRR